MTVFGVDVSYHNGPVNWAAVAADGMGFATIKATSGEASGGTDSPAYFRAQAPAMARAIGLCGGYHWLKPISQTPAAQQVQTFLDVMEQGLGGYEGRLVQLDVEDGTPADVRAWMAEWNRVTNHYPVAGYLPDWLEDRWPGNDMRAFGFAAWWSSEYVAASGLPYRTLAARVTDTQWHEQDHIAPALLQFTSTARVSGVGGPCDVNVYRGTLPQLTALLTRGDDMSAETEAQIAEMHLLLTKGLRAGPNQTSGGGVPIAWLPRVIGELGLDLEQLYAEVDGAEEGNAAVLAAVQATPGVDPQVLAERIAAVLAPAQQQALMDALQRIRVTVSE